VSEGYYPEEVMEHIKDKKELGRGRMKSLYSFTVQSSPSVHGRGRTGQVRRFKDGAAK
jgi:hypothetical protein